ncbi:MAG: EamA family transporter [Bacteroidaceae bacterium]|nr:EamA family transporter [Bacteroidaceae bacterium]
MNYKTLGGHLAAFGAYCIFGFNIVLTKDLTNSHIFTPIALFTFRSLGAGVLFWLLSLFMEKEPVDRKDLPKIFMASLLGYFGTQITFLIGINYSTPLDCSIIASLGPVFTMLVAAVVLKEPITLKKAGGVLMSLAGIILLIMSSATVVSDPSRVTTPLGIGLLLLNCLFFAFYLGIFRPVIQKYSVVTFMKWIFLFSFIMSAPFSIGSMVEVDYSAVPFQCLFELGYLVFMATFVSYFLIPIGQKELRPTLVSLYSYVQPIVASALGIYLGMDRLTPTKMLAIIAVISGVVLVNMSRGKHQKTQ